jgi:aminoglycoside 6'-N-acetyltransferase
MDGPGQAREALPLLHGERVALRPAEARDVPELASILAEPEVARWWGRNDVESVREALGEQPSWAILVDDRVAGWLHVHEEDDPDYRHVAFDIAVATSLRGGGYGREALRLAIRHFAERGHHRFTIDPAADNERAIRSYAAVGFRPVGVLRQAERVPDGTWRDGLLMDLLAPELEA